MIMSPEDAKQSRKFAHQSQSDPPENSTERHFPFAFAAQHYDLIIRLYKPMLKLIPFEKDHDANQRRLKRAFETLLLWGRQYEVSVGELDKLIDRSWRLRRSILRTLTSIGRTLIERLFCIPSTNILPMLILRQVWHLLSNNHSHNTCKIPVY